MREQELKDFQSGYRGHRRMIGLILAWSGMSLSAICLIFYIAIEHGEQAFQQEAQLLSKDIQHKLNANEAVLSGFSSFLGAIDQSDQLSTSRYAAAALAPYPHIYMLEVARRVPRADQNLFEQAMRQGWRSDFKIRNFADIATISRIDPHSDDVWPIVFLHPALPVADPIYGINLDTVPQLSQALSKIGETNKLLAAPPFQLMEGGSALILLQKVERAASANSAMEANFFGNSMVALLLVKTNMLIPTAADPSIGISATLAIPGDNTQHSIFNRPSAPASRLEQLALPHFALNINSESVSQPITITLEHQLRWSELFSPQTLASLFLIFGTYVLVVTSIRRHYQKLHLTASRHEYAEYLAVHDALTGLPNRHLLADRVQQAIKRCQRHGTIAALLVLDLDHFKEINDQFGHDAGDAVLVETSKRIKSLLRSSDTAARYGGDEFIMVINDVLDLHDASIVADKMRQAIAEPMQFGNISIRMTCCLGIAIFPMDGDNFTILRKQADQAMYQAKNGGRNTFVACEPAQNA